MINRVGYSNFWLNNYLNVNSNALGLMNLNLISQLVKNFLIFSQIQNNNYFSAKRFDGYSLDSSSNFKYYRKAEAHHRHTRHRETFFLRSNLSGYLGSSVKLYRVDRWLVINWVVFREFFKLNYKEQGLNLSLTSFRFLYKKNSLSKFEKYLFIKKKYVSSINKNSRFRSKKIVF